MSSLLCVSGEYSSLSPGLSTTPYSLSRESSPLPQHSPNKKEIKWVIWDFDLTITQIHTCAPNMTLEEAQNLDLDLIVADPIVFRNVNLYLQQAGFQIGIASYGRQEIISTIVNRIFQGTENPIRNIVTPNILGTKWKDGHEPPRGLGKVDLLRCFLQLNKCSPEEMILIDDKFENCLAAHNQGYRSRVIEKFGRKDGFLLLAEEDYQKLEKKLSLADFIQLWEIFIS